MKNILIDFLNIYFPDAYAACITGSYVDGNFNTESDIDLWIITNTRDYFFTEAIIFRSTKIQISHYPLFKINETLWLDYTSKSGLYIAGFAKSKILKDNNHYIKNLIDHCKTIYAIGPQELLPKEIQMRKIKVIELVSDLKFFGSPQEGVMIISELFHYFIFFILSYNRSWTFSGKHSIRLLTKLDPDLTQKLLVAYKSFFTSGNPQKIIRLISTQLEHLNDHKNGYTGSQGLLNIKQPYVVMQFYNIKSSHDFIQNQFVTIKKEVSALVENVYFFETRPLGDTIHSTKSIYIVLFNNDMAVADELVSHLNNRLLEKIKYVQPYVAYPINLELDLLFGYQDLIFPIGKYLSALSSWTEKNVINETHSLIAAIILLKDFQNVFFSKSDLYTDFLKYVYKDWLVRSYDNGKVYGIEQLVVAKKRMIALFENQYSLQRDTLIKTYNEAEHAISELIDLKGAIYTRLKVQHPLYLKDKTTDGTKHPNFGVLKDILDISLGTLLIPDEKKAYVAFVLKELTGSFKNIPPKKTTLNIVKNEI